MRAHFDRGSHGLLLHILRAVPLALLPSLLLVMLSMLVLGTHPSTASPSPEQSRAGLLALVATFITMVVAAPLLETVVLGLAIRAAQRLIRRPLLVAAACAAAAGIAHGFALSPAAVLGSAWGFFIFGSGYIAWQRVSGAHAFVAAAAPHAICNLLLFSSMQALAAVR